MPIINTPVSAREDYFDRNPTTRAAEIGTNAVENTGVTTDWTYTVPAARKAFVSLLHAQIIVLTAFTTTTDTDLILALIQMTPSGGSGSNLIVATLRSEGAVVGTRENLVIGGSMMLQAGDAIAGIIRVDGDAAGAGVAQVDTAHMTVEFDA